MIVLNPEVLDEMRQHIPQRIVRPPVSRKGIGMHPDDHEQIRALADALGVSLPDAIMTMLAYTMEEVEGE